MYMEKHHLNLKNHNEIHQLRKKMDLNKPMVLRILVIYLLNKMFQIKKREVEQQNLRQ